MTQKLTELISCDIVYQNEKVCFMHKTNSAIIISVVVVWEDKNLYKIPDVQFTE